MSFPRENFSFCSADKIKRLIDFHQFLSKSTNEPSQLEFYWKRNQLCFLLWRKLLIGWENVSWKWFSLWESWELCSLKHLFTDEKPKMKLSPTSSFDVRWTKNVLFFDDRSRQVKRPIDVLSVCSAANSNKEKFDEIWWRLAQRKISLWQFYSQQFFKQNTNCSMHQFSMAKSLS